MERLQKLLASAGVASRRKCEQLILEGRVSVNGQVVRELGTKVNPETDRIELDHRLVRQERHRYLLLHKPRGVITTADDPQGRETVIDLISDQIGERVFPVGRLDLDTSGLLLLTNDGELANFLMHPRTEIDKTYVAKVEGKVSQNTVQRLEQGVMLEDGMTAPAKVRIISQSQAATTLEIVIHEGRNRQVRRMCDAVGHQVLQLKRVQLAFLRLGNLKPREYRELTPREVERLYDAAQGK